MRRLSAIAVILVILLSLCSAGCKTKSTETSTTKNYQAFLPNPNLTPGDALEVTPEDICTPGYSKKVRDVPESVKRQVYESYGITSRQPREYEVDHLISLELGGSNSARNLWPESYLTGPWNAHVKDRVENKLHRLVCSGQMDLKTAQHEIATDWIAAYRKYVEGPEQTSQRTYDPK